MLFIHTIDKVLSGEKTQTRRLKKSNTAGSYADGQWFAVYNTVTSYPMWQVGRDYAVQPGRGKTSVARIRITSIRREDVRCILDIDAKAEGFKDQLNFLETWTRMHDKAREFYKGDDGFYHYYRGVGYGWQIATGIDIEDMLAHRPAERYQAWALTFEVLATV